MSPIFPKELFTHRLVLISLCIVGMIACGSALYYMFATNVPQAAVPPEEEAKSITATGTVEPAQNPDLAFLSGGRVARLSVSVGQKVTEGQILASLETASLSAQRAQAVAALAAVQAKLDEMNAGPRQVDVQTKQTAVAEAHLTLDNLYASVPAIIAGAYDRSFSGVSNNTDTLFNNPNTSNPTLLFTAINSQLAIAAVDDRVQENADIVAWNAEANALGGASHVQLDTALTSTLMHLGLVRTYCNALLFALSSAVPSSNFSLTSVAAAQTSVTVLRDTIDGLILSIKTEQQQIASAGLTVQAAQDALGQTLAGSTAQSIQAQKATVAAATANVQNVDAQIGNAIIRAPFSGTVSSVHVKRGDIVVPNTVGISLNPESALQINAYVSEADAGKIKSGETADVTLDAYGSNRHFAATVVFVDHSPTMQNSVPAYKVTLQFTQNNPAISSGMTANITLLP